MPAPVTSRYFLVLLPLCLMVTAQTVVRADQIDEHMQREKERLDTILYGMQKGSQATMDGEEARINAEADSEKRNLIEEYRRMRSHRVPLILERKYRMLEPGQEDTYIPPIAADPALLAELEGVELRRKRNIEIARQAANRRQGDAMRESARRNRSLQDSADNIHKQAQDKNDGFGLRKTGTNLYVRQYVEPHKTLPPSRPSVARIVPASHRDD